MVIVELSIKAYANSHWEGGYTLKDFARCIGPLLEGVKAAEIFKLRNMRRYKLEFTDREQAIAFREELTVTLRALHSKATYHWHHVKDPKETNI